MDIEQYRSLFLSETDLPQFFVITSNYQHEHDPHDKNFTAYGGEHTGCIVWQGAANGYSVIITDIRNTFRSEYECKSYHTYTKNLLQGGQSLPALAFHPTIGEDTYAFFTDNPDPCNIPIAPQGVSSSILPPSLFFIYLFRLGIVRAKLVFQILYGEDKEMFTEVVVTWVREAANKISKSIKIELPTNDKRFVKDANGIIVDTNTNLEWYVGPNKDLNHHEANEFVQNLDVDGGGWKLPNISELRKLYQQNTSKCNLDQVFGKFSVAKNRLWVWSSELCDGSDNPTPHSDALRALFFDFVGGCECGEYRDFDLHYRVFAVRSNV